jgi:TolB protein
MHHAAAAALIVLASTSFAQPGANPHAGGPAQPPLDWKSLERPLLRNHVQLTTREQFVKAGEAYFSPDGNWIIFQAVAVPDEGKEADPFYAMYVAKLKRDRFTGLVSGIEQLQKVSPPESANTCGWFHPRDPWRVMFGSTLVRPKDDEKAGFQVGLRTYRWMFPEETEVCTREVEAIFKDGVQRLREKGPGLNDRQAEAIQMVVPDTPATPVFTRPHYDAECSYSADGRFILYAHVEDQKEGDRPDRRDADIYVYDTQTKKHHALVMAKGYDGGPFFSPDGKSIGYRSDRRGDDLLQLFVADLKFESGVPVGIEREYQLTDNSHVNWCPYWHPSGKYMVYGTSEVGHHNYEVFAIETDMSGLRAGKSPSEMKHARVTQADGADVLPSFSPDATMMMWTSQRGAKIEGEEKGSSQLWVATFGGDPLVNGKPAPVRSKAAADEKR